MSLLKTQQTIHIPLYYMEKELQDGVTKTVILEDDDAKKMLEDEEKKDKVEVLNTNWKTLNWKEQNEITKKATIYDQMSGMQDIDVFDFRDKRIKTCLVSWDLKDESGRDVPVDPNVIDMLPSEVVLTLANKYDSLITLTKEDEKK